MLSEETKSQLEQLIGGNEVVLFMKGQRRLPQCGFSAQVVSLLDQMVDDYLTVNVLDDASVREGIKAYSNWPTIPQLYVHGKFVGGCDIVTAMFENGDLHGLFGKSAPVVEPPSIALSDSAVAALKEPLAEEGAGNFIRLVVDPQWRPGLDIGPKQDGDLEVDANGLTVLVDRGSAQRANGISIDFVPGAAGGFKIENPNEPPRVKTIPPAELKARLDAGDALELLDVRTPQEREMANIEGSRILDQEAANHIHGLDREETVLVFLCKSGQRSMAAAQHFLQQGFTKVYNVRGGINAWSREVDPSVPLY